MGKENSSTIWPILYFEADWPSKSYKFDLGVQLLKADKTTLEKIAGIDSPAYTTNISGFDDIHQNTQWFLAMHHPEVIEHVSVNEVGMSFVDSFQGAIVESFLMTLQLVHSTTAICPFKFLAEIREDSIVEVDTSDDFYGINSDKPDVYLPETFEIGDLQLITDLWSFLINLRKLDLLIKLFNKEEFFAECDKAAGEDATKRMVDFLMSHPAYLEISEKERKQRKEKWTSSIKEVEDKGEWWQEYYKESFQKIFSEKQDEMFSNRTRIGRALNLFSKGLHLPLQHSFLSMCLVLETIFTVEGAEITYQFATRLANITGKTFEQRKDVFQRARKVYRERSNIVHGRKSIETVDTDILKDGFFFARQSLHRILLDSNLLELYSDPITSDKTKNSDKAIKAIRDYFRDLDLR
ncbi:MAG: hypothetical protein FVQ85_09705 [Planctomycetes bacterium]|nr:hypothetical protein [Planctomycetota bacterium]